MIQIVSYGAGTNSTAMLVEMARLGERIDAVTFADTGGERPETYAHIDTVSGWLTARGYPPVTVLRNDAAKVGDSIVPTLEEECLQRKALPSIAYGFGKCSDKWKQVPFRRWLAGRKAIVCIGFDADEPHRAKRGDQYNDYRKRYPLIEWGWGREECVAAIAASGLTQPGKSACFFCPSSRPREILDLRDKHPDLLARALAIEANAELTHIAGLGRRFAWRDLVAFNDAQMPLFETELPCGCYDGE